MQAVTYVCDVGPLSLRDIVRLASVVWLRCSACCLEAIKAREIRKFVTGMGAVEFPSRGASGEMQ